MTKKIITICLVASFFFSAFTPVVLAEDNSQDKDSKAVNQYQNAKDNYLKTVNAYKNVKRDFLDAKNKWQGVKDKTGTQELLSKTQGYLTKALQTMINYLTAIKKKAENAPFLSDAEKTAIIADLDKDINWLTQKQTDVQKATTRQQLVDNAKTIRNEWLRIKDTAKKVTGLMLSAKINQAITKAKDISLKAQTEINNLNNQGKNTEDLEAWLSDYNSKVALAEAKYIAAKEKFNAIGTAAKADKLFVEGHQFLKEANSYLKQAHADLKEIVKAIKQSGISPTPAPTSTPTTTTP